MQRKHLSLGEAIKLNRERLHMTRAQLAEAIGIKYSTLSNYENDAREPELETLWQLAEYFQMTIDQFLTNAKTEAGIYALMHNQGLDDVEVVALLQAVTKIEHKRQRQIIIEIVEQCTNLNLQSLTYVQRIIAVFNK